MIILILYEEKTYFRAKQCEILTLQANTDATNACWNSTKRPELDRPLQHFFSCNTTNKDRLILTNQERARKVNMTTSNNLTPGPVICLLDSHDIANISEVKIVQNYLNFKRIVLI